MVEHTIDSSMTWGEWFESAIACKTEEDAKAWLDIEIKRHKKLYGNSKRKALPLIHSNLGYMAGYYDQETASKVLALFGAAHPIFEQDYF